MKRNIKTGVVTTSRVNNLNAQYLNGRNEDGFFRRFASRSPGDDNITLPYNSLGIELWNGLRPDHLSNDVYGYGNLLYFGNAHRTLELYYHDLSTSTSGKTTPGIYVRSYTRYAQDDNKGNWQEIIFSSTIEEKYIKKSDLQKILDESNTFEEFKTKFNESISQISTLKSELGGGQLSENQ